MSEADQIRNMRHALERVVAEAYPSLGFFPTGAHIVLSEGALAEVKRVLAECDHVH